MRFFTSAAARLRALADALLPPSDLDVKPEPRERRAFLVRTGLYVPSASPPSEWELSDEGKEQAKQAAADIRRRAGDVTPTVFVCLDSPISYQDTARTIAKELGVEPVFSHLRFPPGESELGYLEQFEGPVVIVADGSNLEWELHKTSGPEFAEGFLGPRYGSVHELVIEYLGATPLRYPRETARYFV